MNHRFHAPSPAALPLVLAFAFAAGCASGDPYFVDTRADAQPQLSPSSLAAELADYDVVFLGEIHDNVAGHQQHLELVQALHKERSDLALSFEMFERDIANELEAFVDGSGTEEAFVAAMEAAGNKWSGYDRDYRPMVVFAKENGMPVIAANVPRKLASKVAKEGPESVVGEPLAARDIWTRKDAYYEKFKGEMGFTGAQLETYYAAQCLKDCTMAESIADFLANYEGDAPLVVHKNGNFHSDSHLGTVAMLRQMRPDLDIAVVTMVELGGEDADPTAGDFALFVPKQMRKEVMGGHPVHPPSKHGGGKRDGDEPEHGELPKGESPHGESPHAAGPEAAANPHAAAGVPQGRPALGFKPDYETPVDGCLIEMVTPGGAAERAGLKADDTIVELAGVPVDSFQTYMEALSTVTVGSTIDVIVMRGTAEKREEKTFKVVVGSR